jgi:outer membrane protein insertion porin family
LFYLKLRGLLILVTPVFLCTGLRHLEEGQSTLHRKQHKIEPVDEPIPNKRAIESELEAVLRPEPNSRILISRPRLWIHNVMGETGESGDGLLDTDEFRPASGTFWEVDTERRVRLMQNRLFNMGYFDAEVDFQSEGAATENLNRLPCLPQTSLQAKKYF